MQRHDTRIRLQVSFCILNVQFRCVLLFTYTVRNTLLPKTYIWPVFNVTFIRFLSFLVLGC